MTNDTGMRLRKAMFAANVTVNGLSRETGLSRSTIRHMREGNVRGSLYSWVKVSRVLGVSVSELIGDGIGNELSKA